MSSITVFTPTYNRCRSLHRVYESLYQQTYRDFEWLIIDDGSNDTTKDIVDGFKKSANFPIRYFYQENSGKHIAINRAVALCKSEFFIIADSDDAFKPESLAVFMKEWELIPRSDRGNFKGLICKCYDAETGKDIGDFPGNRIDATELDAGFKMKFKFEKWSFFRTDVLREFPFPEPKEHLKFYPETVVWQRMSRKYQTRYINVALRAYYRDQENALTGTKTLRYSENKYLWLHYINDTVDYAPCNIKLFLKSFVGISRDALLCGMTRNEILQLENRRWKRVITTILYPIAFLLCLFYKNKHGLNMRGGVPDINIYCLLYQQHFCYVR